MTELMNCQLCGGDAYFTSADVGEECWVGSEGCGLCGPILHFPKVTHKERREMDYATHLKLGEACGVVEEEAKLAWNRLQALIARGLLLEEEAGVGTKGGRL